MDGFLFLIYFETKTKCPTVFWWADHRGAAGVIDFCYIPHHTSHMIRHGTNQDGQSGYAIAHENKLRHNKEAAMCAYSCHAYSPNRAPHPTR
eukprot:scaffold6566_cov125-Amphora_coffeaeformis.AAC.8